MTRWRSLGPVTRRRLGKHPLREQLVHHFDARRQPHDLDHHANGFLSLAEEGLVEVGLGDNFDQAGGMREAFPGLGRIRRDGEIVRITAREVTDDFVKLCGRRS